VLSERGGFFFKRYDDKGFDTTQSLLFFLVFLFLFYDLLGE
jgi:hypothetical protein